MKEEAFGGQAFNRAYKNQAEFTQTRENAFKELISGRDNCRRCNSVVFPNVLVADELSTQHLLIVVDVDRCFLLPYSC